MFPLETLDTAGPRNFRVGYLKVAFRAIQALIEISILVGAFVFAYLLRFDFGIPSSEVAKIFIQLPIVLALQVVALRAFGAHRFIWRYTSAQDAASIAKALGAVLLLLLVARSIYSIFPSAVIVPISIAIVNCFVAFLGVLGVRMTRRVVHERSNRASADRTKKKPVILVGAGRAGVLTLAEVTRRGDIDIDVRAFVDDDTAKHGALINGVKVMGGTDDLPVLVRKLGIDHVIISIARASRSEFQNILKKCQAIPIRVRTIPGLYELLQGNVTVSRIRDIEVEDLLCREPVELEPTSINRFLTDKVVMVTGAGGSILSLIHI